ncbi:hypothetical protein GOP47_0024012 [Adiantum capillus-veneris]|uniref:Uncharacterized protein n=1 Tax=Adiantum capillus-veneris TaxID=13818 RepID=A0A9D4Z5Q8_ADICA|nr:hypothetical protein GOP47_0024012 [Adiantum capillus-veneris]
MASLHLQLQTIFASRRASSSRNGARTSSSFTNSCLRLKAGIPPKLSSSFVPRASTEGLPAELLEDAKFVPINDDDPQYGPPALMLMGFSHSEAVKVQALLKNMQGDFLKVLICTDDMIKGTLWNAMHVSQPELEDMKASKDVPRICFLSGLTGEELMMFVRAFPDAKLEPTAFAAMVPNNAQKTIEELMEEIMGDHERLTKERK